MFKKLNFVFSSNICTTLKKTASTYFWTKTSHIDSPHCKLWKLYIVYGEGRGCPKDSSEEEPISFNNYQKDAVLPTGWEWVAVQCKKAFSDLYFYPKNKHLENIIFIMTRFCNAFNMQKIFLCSVQWILRTVHEHCFYSTVSTGSDRYQQVRWVRLMQEIRKRTQLSSIVCLAKGFVCV